jgi:hypothetical protein
MRLAPPPVFLHALEHAVGRIVEHGLVDAGESVPDPIGQTPLELAPALLAELREVQVFSRSRHDG